MTNSGQPRRLPLPRSRRLTTDVLHYHRKVPTCAHDRECDLSRLDEVRRALPERISWSLLFIKAFAIIAREHPVLRQTYFNWPWPHLYEHPHSVAMVALEREYRNDRWLFWTRFTSPETTPLIDLQQALNKYQTGRVKNLFKQQLQLSGLPTIIRRMLWWWTLNVSGVKRAKRTGTVFLTTLAAKQTIIQHPPAFLTSNMTYGPLDDAGRCRITIAYDHRLMDGSTVADQLADLERALNGPIADELEELIARATPSQSKAEDSKVA